MSNLMSDPIRDAAKAMQAFTNAHNASEQAEFEDLADRFWERTSPGYAPSEEGQ